MILQELGYRGRGWKSYEEGTDALGSEAVDFIIVSEGNRCLDMGCYLEAMKLGAVDYLVGPLMVSEIGRVLESVPRVQRIAA